MRGLIDLHCHWLPGVDDGARSLDEGASLLAGLSALGFETVIATPHMRPGMFDNTREQLIGRFEATLEALAGYPGLPELRLGSEHYFDDVVFARLLAGQGLPLAGGRAVLLEFYELDFPPTIDRCFADLRRAQLLPVIAHPERYRSLWRRPEVLERLLDVGAVALLDSAALVGKYGKEPRRWAEEFLQRGLYHAACSDAHRPSDAVDLRASMRWLERAYGQDELEYLFRDGPASILAGEIPR